MERIKTKKILILFGFVMPSLLIAQKLKEVQLGVIKGEMKHYQGQLSWINENSKDEQVNFWTDKQWLKLPDSTFNVSRGDTLNFGYNISLNQVVGLQHAEIRLLDADGIILDGFIVQGRFLLADTLTLESYRNDHFPFKAQEQVFNIGRGFTNQEFSKVFTLYNFGGDSLDLTNVASENDNLKFYFNPSLIGHNQFTRMELLYSPNQTKRIGFNRENLNLRDEKGELIAVLPVQYTLEENLKTMNDASPQLSLSLLTYDFKVMKTGTLKQVSITLSNSGDADLTLYKIESNCDCLSYSLKDEVLLPGQSSELVVQFNAAQRLGFERKTLAIFSNDPHESTRVLVFKAHVK